MVRINIGFPHSSMNCLAMEEFMRVPEPPATMRAYFFNILTVFPIRKNRFKFAINNDLIKNLEHDARKITVVPYSLKG